MCGIVAYVGNGEASGILLEGLARLEYRGYDSAGVAIQNGKGLDVRKVEGAVSGLRALLGADPVVGRAGIGHTRWPSRCAYSGSGPPTAGSCSASG